MNIEKYKTLSPEIQKVVFNELLIKSIELTKLQIKQVNHTCNAN